MSYGRNCHFYVRLLMGISFNVCKVNGRNNKIRLERLLRSSWFCPKHPDCLYWLRLYEKICLGVKLIQSFLTNRYQRTKTDSTFSEELFCFSFSIYHHQCKWTSTDDLVKTNNFESRFTLVINDLIATHLMMATHIARLARASKRGDNKTNVTWP